ncbi:MAG TPA: serine/threonine-protein kinase [Pyrinomonadaceae bacterium]|nr:serine/threonine-protein kinase [Pyrinomonadaceae bacterium]
MSELENYVGQVLDEKYLLEYLLGQGGMGAVYLATHLGTERFVALKLITPQFMRDEEFVERFRREARAAGRLRHPNVVDVTDFGFARAGAERVAYLVMEYLDGCTLGDVLAEERRLPLEWVVDILEQVSSAVSEAHQQGVVHRDLKPDNIWLEPNRLGGYHVKVLDFGIAKLAEADAVGACAPAQLAEARTPGAGDANTLIEASHTPRADSNSEDGTLLLPSTGGARDGGRRAVVEAHAAAGKEESRVAGDARPLVEAAEVDVVGTQSVEKSDARSAAETADTQLFTAAHEGRPAAATQPPGEDERTLMLEASATGDEMARATSTAAAGGLTRVGSIMGTPQYMSPEQCRGERLDARSDIYSLGVIAYQMLAGETPFEGDMLAVMRQHIESPPPQLREKNRKVPKRVARVVMGALAKDRAERPQTAAAFANSLGAYAGGVSALVRRAFALYSEYFPKFLRLSLVAHIPLVLLIPMAILYTVYEKSMSEGAQITLGLLLALFQMAANFATASVIVGMTALMVTQLQLAPLRPLQLRTAIIVLRRRLRPYLRTSLGVVVRILLGYLLFLIPGLVMTIRYAVYAPVVLLEGLSKKAALRRARELAGRSWRTVIGVAALQICIPMLVGGVVGVISGSAPKNTHGAVSITINQVPALLSPLANIIITPLTSIMMALLYLKLRQMGGESLGETLAQFETPEDTRSLWQQRMRTRLTVQSTSQGRSGSVMKNRTTT